MKRKKAQYLKLLYTLGGLAVVSVIVYLLMTNYTTIFAPKASSTRNIIDCNRRCSDYSAQRSLCSRCVADIERMEARIVRLEEKYQNGECNRKNRKASQWSIKCGSIILAERSKVKRMGECAAKDAAYDRCKLLMTSEAGTLTREKCMKDCRAENQMVLDSIQNGTGLDGVPTTGE